MGEPRKSFHSLQLPRHVCAPGHLRRPSRAEVSLPAAERPARGLDPVARMQTPWPFISPRVNARSRSWGEGKRRPVGADAQHTPRGCVIGQRSTWHRGPAGAGCVSLRLPQAESQKHWVTFPVCCQLIRLYDPCLSTKRLPCARHREHRGQAEHPRAGTGGSKAVVSSRDRGAPPYERHGRGSRVPGRRSQAHITTRRRPLPEQREEGGPGGTSPSTPSGHVTPSGRSAAHVGAGSFITLSHPWI